MDCEKIQELLTLYIEGEVTDEEKNRIELHLQQCSPCSIEMKQLKQTMSLLSEKEMVSLPTDFEVQLKERLKQEKKDISQKKSHVSILKKFISKYKLPTAAAAGLLFVVMISQSFFQFKASEDIKINEGAADMGVRKSASMQIEENVVESTASSETQSQKVEEKIIKTAHLAIEVIDFDKQYSNIRKIVQQYQGYIENSTLDYYSTENQKRYKQASILLRIPKEHYNEVIEVLLKIGIITTQSENTSDVIKQYLDNEARIKMLKIQEERLLEIMKKASKVDELIQLESRISEVRTQIEMYQTEQKNINQSVAYTTIQVNLIEVPKYQQMQDEGKGLAERMLGSVIASIKFFRTLGESLLIAISALLIPGIIGSIGFFIYLTVRRKKKNH